MSDNPRISLIHATPLAISPIESAFKRLWPEVEAVSLLDQALSIDRAKHDSLTDELHDRVVALGKYADGLSPAAILYTCSAFGTAIEEVARTTAVPVLKPNEAMFEEALTVGPRVAMVYTFPASVAGMEQEFQNYAADQNLAASLTSTYAEGARSAIEAGDRDEHNRIIAETVGAVKNADVVLLAHFSMAIATEDSQSKSSVPVLNSPESAVNKLKAMLQ